MLKPKSTVNCRVFVRLADLVVIFDAVVPINNNFGIIVFFFVNIIYIVLNLFWNEIGYFIFILTQLDLAWNHLRKIF